MSPLTTAVRDGRRPDRGPRGALPITKQQKTHGDNRETCRLDAAAAGPQIGAGHRRIEHGSRGSPRARCWPGWSPSRRSRRSSNLDLVDFVEAYLAEPGVASLRVPDADRHKAGLWRWSGPRSPAASCSPATPTSSRSTGQAWTGDPLDADRARRAPHGRGACDMKGFVATALALVPEMLAAAPRAPDHPRAHLRRGDRLPRRPAADRGDARAPGRGRRR